MNTKAFLSLKCQPRYHFAGMIGSAGVVLFAVGYKSHMAAPQFIWSFWLCAGSSAALLLLSTAMAGCHHHSAHTATYQALSEVALYSPQNDSDSARVLMTEIAAAGTTSVYNVSKPSAAETSETSRDVNC